MGRPFTTNRARQRDFIARRQATEYDGMLVVASAKFQRSIFKPPARAASEWVGSGSGLPALLSGPETEGAT